MVWGFCYLRIFKKVQSISGRSLYIGIALTTTSHQQPEVTSVIRFKIRFSVTNLNSPY
jgi:hypothetical protein